MGDDALAPPLNDSMNSFSVGFPDRENSSAIFFQYTQG